MPSLAGAVTRLTLAGVPGHATWVQLSFSATVADTYVPVLAQSAAAAGGALTHNRTDTFVPRLTMTASVVGTATWPVVDAYVPVLTQSAIVLGGARPDDGQFTTLTLAGVPGRVNIFTDKPTSVADAKPVTDTYLAVLVLGDVTDVALQLTDDYRPTLAMSATPHQSARDERPLRAGAADAAAEHDQVRHVPEVRRRHLRGRRWRCWRRSRGRMRSLPTAYVPMLAMSATLSGSAVRRPGRHVRAGAGDGLLAHHHVGEHGVRPQRHLRAGAADGGEGHGCWRSGPHFDLQSPLRTHPHRGGVRRHVWTTREMGR